MLKLRKTEISFGELVTLNVKLKKGEIKNLEINEELAQLIHDKMISVCRVGNKSICISSVEGIVKNQKATIHYKINKGWTIIEVNAYIMGDVLIINKSNGDTGELIKYYFKVI